MFRYNTVIAPTYILSQIELEAKGYGIKNSIANLNNQLSCTSDATNVLEYNKLGQGSVDFGVQTKREALLLVHLTQ